MGYERDERRYGRERYGYGGDDEDRGFFQRAGDEVRSWFGDEEAERRRREDERYDERYDRDDRGAYGRSGYRGDQDRGGYARGGRFAENAVGGYRAPEAYPRWYRSNRDEAYRGGADRGGPARSGYRAGGYAGYDQDVEAGRQFDDYRGGRGGDHGRSPYGERGGRPQRDGRYAASPRADDHDDYRGWRDRQIDTFDRDYDEYRQQNRQRFESEFAAWRQGRQTQRDSLQTVKEHQEVVGSDGAHVGKVDHVRGDHILLAKTDPDAGGHHHTIPSSWIASVAEKVTLSRTAAEAKAAWRDADERGGLFGGGSDKRGEDRSPGTGGNLNRSFSGTY